MRCFSCSCGGLNSNLECICCWSKSHKTKQTLSRGYKKEQYNESQTSIHGVCVGGGDPSLYIHSALCNSKCELHLQLNHEQRSMRLMATAIIYSINNAAHTYTTMPFYFGSFVTHSTFYHMQPHSGTK